ncbi:MAG: hypothetical protein KQH83_04020 [Actinobacteria bacterium]|nr:hypothetical protein [Actinomycetota bacterium]
MEPTRSVQAGASALALAAVLLAACTAPAGAGIPGVSPTAGPSPNAAAAPAAAATPEPDATAGDATAGEALPDITARPIATSDLLAMLPPGGDGALLANEDLIVAATLDRADEAADIAQYGRVTGAAAAYPSSGSTSHVVIGLFATGDGAAGWVGDAAGDIVKGVGGTHAVVEATAVDDYPLDVGQDAVGLLVEIGGGEATETVALFRVGRLAVLASVTQPGAADGRVRAQYLAEEVEASILSTLTATDAPADGAGPAPSSYEFAFERTVEIGGERWSVSSSGTVSGADVACTVEADLPGLSAGRDLVLAGGRLWADGTAAVSAAGAVDRALIAFCPAWPADPGAAGLSGAMDGTPARHEVGGLAALGYRGDAGDLEAAFGVPAGSAEVAVFTFWVAAQGGWLVGLDLRVEGDASSLAQVIGTGYPSGTARVVVSQHLAAIGEAAAVTPPG